MSPFDLTTLAALKAWLGLPAAPGPNDATLAALITAASRSIYALLEPPRACCRQSYTETIDLETQRVFLRQWPVLQVNCGDVARNRGSARRRAPTWRRRSATRFSRATPLRPGRPQALDLFGGYYRPGRQSLVVSYSAGYAVQGEAQTVPAAAPLQLAAFAPYGPWASDLGVDLRRDRRAADAGLGRAGAPDNMR